MNIFNNKQVATLALVMLCYLSQGKAWAEDLPDTQSMIDSLKPIKTRSLRNLLANPASSQQPTAIDAGSSLDTPTTANTSNAAPSLPEHPVVSDTAVPSLSLAIQFESNSAQVSSSSQQALARLATALRSDDLRSFHFLIEGHTDAKGLPAHNRKLSQQRANAVKNVLIAQGVSSQQLRAIGKGADEPANREDPFAAENRRVRIVNLDIANQ
ncbi:OmpA family protein [Crenobacter sp. SG2303]|uniref:OmpA family protein n=1 Tax=Crenobacter oryzisoli TaxID=3056844 RepID=A0ABT7XMU1_9NEIS|nr:OmpA family protein [Crenobacter sp. SG2303]MDN0075106.1 OmpA family protein [Crenobacter sp. SG2303]